MVVYNLAHIKRSPRSQQASIRLLGFVNNIEKANELVSELGLCDKIDGFMKNIGMDYNIIIVIRNVTRR